MNGNNYSKFYSSTKKRFVRELNLWQHIKKQKIFKGMVFTVFLTDLVYRYIWYWLVLKRLQFMDSRGSRFAFDTCCACFLAAVPERACQPEDRQQAHVLHVNIRHRHSSSCHLEIYHAKILFIDKSEVFNWKEEVQRIPFR